MRTILKFDARLHRAQLVFRPVSRANQYNDINWGERAAEFGVDALTMNQQRALIVYNSELKDIYGTDDLTFSTASQNFMGVDIQYVSVAPKTLSGAEFKEASYYISMMGGWEYDIQCYSNFVVEPSKGMKQLLGLITKPNNTPKPYVELVDTANDAVPVSEGGQQLKNHPLYSPKTRLYVGSPVKGSFWQFPIQIKHA